MRILFGCLLVLTLSLPAWARQMQGRVFIDSNRDGVADAGEKGLSGIGVSDGITIARTGADGTYQIETPEKGRLHLFVIVPSGYAARRGFFRRLMSETTRIDFPLEAAPETAEATFDFVHLTDVHVNGPLAQELLPRMIAEVESLRPRPRFLLVTGDLSYVGYTELMFSARAFSSAAIPTFILPGNHDKSPRQPDSFEAQIGPAWYSFNYGPVHFLVLDDNQTTTNDGFMLTSPQVEWIEKDLALVSKETPIILAHHRPVPPRPLEKDAPWLKKVYESHRVLIDLNGHTHTNRTWRIGETEVVETGESSALWNQRDYLVPSYRVVHFEKGRVTHTARWFEPNRDPGSEKYLKTQDAFRVTSPFAGAVTSLQVPVRAGYYDFESGQVRMQVSLDGGAWQSLDADPSGNQGWRRVLNVEPGAHSLRVEAYQGERLLGSGEVRFRARAAATPAWTVELPKARWITPGAQTSRSAPPGAETWSAGGSVRGIRDVQGPVFAVAGPQLVAIDSSSGRKLWEAALEKDENCQTAMAAAIFCTIANGIQARSAETGQILWKRRLDAQPGVLFASPAGVLALAYRAGAPSWLLDAKSGAPLWRNIVSGEAPGARTSRSASDDRSTPGRPAGLRSEIDELRPTVLSLDEQAAYIDTPAGDIVKISLADGSSGVLFHKPIFGEVLRLLALPGLVVVADTAGQVYGIDRELGRARWTFDAHAMVNGPVWLPGNRLGISTKDGWAYAIDPETGLAGWQTFVGGGPLLDAIQLGERFIVRSGQMTAVLEARTGLLIQRFQEERLFTNGLVANGNLWLTNDGTKLSALPLLRDERN